MAEPLRVVLADDHYLLRDGVAALLEGPDVEVVGTASDGAELLEVARRARPDAVLTDIRMPPDRRTEGIEAALTLRRERPAPGVVVLSQHLEEAYVRALFCEGSAGLGYLLKDRVGDRAELVDALGRVARGESVLDRRVVDLLTTSGAGDPLHGLTERERDVLALMAEGRTNPGIATRLHLSLSAVEKHVSSIFAKLGTAEQEPVDRRVSAVLAWLREAGAGPAPSPLD